MLHLFQPEKDRSTNQELVVFTDGPLHHIETTTLHVQSKESLTQGNNIGYVMRSVYFPGLHY